MRMHTWFKSLHGVLKWFLPFVYVTIRAIYSAVLSVV